MTDRWFVHSMPSIFSKSLHSSKQFLSVPFQMVTHQVSEHGQSNGVTLMPDSFPLLFIIYKGQELQYHDGVKIWIPTGLLS